jgi:hypothetical protein
VTTDGSYRDRYGYKFWRVQNGGYAALGMAGQVIVMHPDKDLVFIGTANGFQTDNHYFHLEFFWQLLFPELAGGPVPYDDDAYSKLTDYVNRAEIFLPGGASDSPAGRKYSGRFLPVRENALGCSGFILTLNDSGGELALRTGGRDLIIPFGYGAHIPGPAGLHKPITPEGRGKYPNGCAAAGRWADEKTLVVQSHVLDTLQYFIITLHFSDRAAVLEIAPYGIHRYDNIPCRLTCVM